MPAYCVIADTYAYGVPRGGLPNPARPIADVSTTANTLTCSGHALDDDDELRFRVESGGSMPSPLAAGTTYYAIPIDADRFSVASAAGGAAIDITTAGANFSVITALPWAKWIAWASDMVDQFTPAHVSIELDGNGAYPPIVVACAADLVASRALSYTGTATVDMQARLKAANDALARRAKGVPIKGQPRAQRGNTAVRCSSTAADVRGWERGDRRLIP